jgi:hypothetical protein
MKQVAIIGTAFVALAAGPLAQSAWSMPADVTPVVQSQTVEPLPAVPLELGSTQRLAVQPASGMTKAEHRALILRSEALNRKYGLGGTAPRTPVATSTRDFQWGDAGIGAAVLVGAVALIGAGFFEVRQHGRLGTS